MKKILLSALISMLVVFPLSGYTAKPISQEFPNDSIVTVFPISKNFALMVVLGDGIYTSTRPGSAFDWKKANYQFKDNGEEVLGGVTASVSVSYRNYEYVFTDAGDRYPGDYSHDPSTTEIWRLPHKNPKKIERVLQLPALQEGMDNTFGSLFVFNEKIYGITHGGELWKSVSGKAWKMLPSKGLSKYSYIWNSDSATGTVFIANGNQLYRSRNLVSWKRVQGAFNTDDVLTIDGLNHFNDQMYLTTRTSDDIAHLWRKDKGGKWKETITQKEPHLSIYTTTLGDHIYLVRQMAQHEWVIKKSTDGKHFTKVVETADMPMESLLLGNKAVFLMYNGEKGTSYLLRVP